MLIIRDDQMDPLRAIASSAYRHRLANHLKQVFPERCAALGQRELYSAIDHGIATAARYGLKSEREVCKFIDLMFVFGRYFDLPSEQPWAARVLQDRSTRTATELTDALFARALRNMHRAWGIQPVVGHQER